MSWGKPWRPPMKMECLMDCVREEMRRQDEKWGWPRPVKFLEDDDDLHGVFVWLEKKARQLFAKGKPCWMAILGEEIGEVARESKEVRIAELVQVAAVALSWAQAIEEQGEGS